MGKQNKIKTADESEAPIVIKNEVNVKKEGYSDKEDSKPVINKVKKEGSSEEEKPKIGGKKPKEKGGSKKENNKKKILAYMAEELQTLDRKRIPQQELAEICGYAKPGSHGFFYAFSELKAENMIMNEKGGAKLTESGLCSVPKEKIAFAKPKTNKEKQDYYFKLLRRKCTEGTPEKVKIIFELLSDGKPHKLEEFVEATGYRNLKSKGLGYNLTCMEKELKILKKLEKNSWVFTDKCFPEGRPA